PRAARAHAPAATVGRPGGRARAEAEDLRRGRADPPPPARRARVRAPLRGGVVDGDPVDRVPPWSPPAARRADRPGEVRRVHHAARPEPVPRAAARVLRLQLARLAVRRGPAPRAEAEEPAPLRRSEEHTSELQSLAYLVCRLLLE